MQWFVETDLAAYGKRVLPWLERDPVRNTVPATVLMTRLDGTYAAAGVWTAWLADDDGEVAAVALRTPPRGVLVSALPPGAADACARLFDAGAPAVVLFADRANPTSTGVYTRLGFRPVAEQEDWVLEY